ncbi:uncharacterized protein LOC132831139 [Hemiscyllium ocellatum]|uniref:uncharacterized protein LOC132831139 n=1 Tax=Hemiscyllium ocellatum TaxID=170820 RepID=UPI0029664F32|nr:uncharacterized protein LOC132831139 [Hemiscyllium ocellatum]XP_060705117.1 uncharacterized protein LOC132831139 [Hemiscyllium ocellatum]XP_060705118.1 uncharacterized protein LOC132831139 [Hemiscyllium ocellatum]XP_060705119.1 uncharacterized protein LOC132831139 [Hemiscyllium ocellatum]
MECPLCGNWFSEAVIQHHAWNCDGSRLEEGLLTQHGAASVAGENYQLATCTSHFHQHLDGVGSVVFSNITAVPHCSTEYSQETTAVKTQECPVCGQSFPTNEIIEHAAFCNGPGFSKVLEQEIPSYSKVLEREGAIDTMELFWRYVNEKEHAVPRAVVGAEGAKRVLSSKEVEEDNVLDLEKILQYLKKMEDNISQDPEFKEVFGPLLKSPNPLSLLQSLSNTIFNQKVAKGAGKAAPVFLLFQLAKLCLPAILKSEAFAVFKKWVEAFILEIVVPWISQMGGWGPVLCALASLLASGLIVGLKVLLMSPTK